MMASHPRGPDRKYIRNVCSKLKVDLAVKAGYELDFLRHIHEHEFFFDPDFVQCAIFRYEELWLPFLKAFSANSRNDYSFVPPWDIHWIWHVHMLSPLDYEEDCLHTYGRVFGHRLRPLKALSGLRRETEIQWYQFYPGELFHLTTDQVNLFKIKIREFRSTFACDLAAKVQEQRSFYYQVSLPHFSTVLEDGFLRYQMFLWLMNRDKKSVLIATPDIHLIWHTHLLHPRKYSKAMTRIFGQIVRHECHTEASTGDLDCTEQQWRRAFGRPLFQPGVMFRGRSTKGRLVPADLWEIKLRIFAPQHPYEHTAHLRLKRGQFVPREIRPEEWSLVPWPDNSTVPCRGIVAEHSIRSCAHEIMTLKVLHSVERAMSALQIFVDGNMVMLCHLVGVDTLGSPDDEDSRFRAMIIKDAQGDAGLCSAKWVVNRDDEGQGTDGFVHAHCHIKYHNFRNGDRCEALLPNQDSAHEGQFVLNWGDKLKFISDLATDDIFLASETVEDPVLSVALDLVCAILYLLVQPRALAVEDEKPSGVTDRQLPTAVSFHHNSEIAMFQAVGWSMWEELPSVSTYLYAMKSFPEGLGDNRRWALEEEATDLRNKATNNSTVSVG